MQLNLLSEVNLNTLYLQYAKGIGHIISDILSITNAFAYTYTYTKY